MSHGAFPSVLSCKANLMPLFEIKDLTIIKEARDMEYNYEDHEWEEILSSGTEIQLQDGGRITANYTHKTPQTISIVDSSDTEIPESNPDLPGEFTGLPSAVMISGISKRDNNASESRVNIIHVIKSIERGDSEVLSK